MVKQRTAAARGGREASEDEERAEALQKQQQQVDHSRKSIGREREKDRPSIHPFCSDNSSTNPPKDDPGTGDAALRTGELQTAWEIPDPR